MRAFRSIQPDPHPLTSSDVRDGQIAVLGEIVTQLAERIEVLEERERIGRAVLCGPQSRLRKRS